MEIICYNYEDCGLNSHLKKKSQLLKVGIGY